MGTPDCSEPQTDNGDLDIADQLTWFPYPMRPYVDWWAILWGSITIIVGVLALLLLCGSTSAQCGSGSCGRSVSVGESPGWFFTGPTRAYSYPIPPANPFGLYRTEYHGSIITIWGWPDPGRRGYIQWMPSYEPNQLILARARLFGEALASQ